VISLGLCLDLTTTAGVEQVRTAHRALAELAARVAAHLHGAHSLLDELFDDRLGQRLAMPHSA
jgi:hypothetical protein